MKLMLVEPLWSLKSNSLKNQLFRVSFWVERERENYLNPLPTSRIEGQKDVKGFIRNFRR